LAGACIAQAGFARRLPRATILGVIAANIPDVDALTYFGADSAFAVSFRRGITHGIPALIIWAVGLTALFSWLARKRPRAVVDAGPQVPAQIVKGYFLLALIAVVSHPSLDWMNTYGVRFLAPFSDRWFYGDTLFIVDLFLIGVLAAGWLTSRVMLARRHARSAVPARVAIGLALAYIVMMKTMSEVTRGAAARSYALEAPSPRELMVVPRPLSITAREVLVSDGEFYRGSSWRWSGLGVERGATMESRERTGADSATVAAVRATTDGARFLVWSRFPYFAPDPASGTVFVGDLRYSSGTSESWAGIRIRTGDAAGR
jgi:inner membrane protein